MDLADFAAHGLLPPTTHPKYPSGRSQRVCDVFDWVLDEDPDREALVGRHGRFSYGQLDAAANRAAAALADLGVGVGDRVAACLPNDVDIVVAFLASLRLGAVWVGVSRPLAGPEKAYLLRDCGAGVYLASPEMVREIERERGSLPDLVHLVEADPALDGAAWA